MLYNYYSECFNSHPVYSFSDDGDWTFINSNCVEKNIVKYIKYDSAGNKIIFERSRDGEVNYGEYKQYDYAGNETKIEVDYDGDGTIDNITNNKWEFFPFD